MAELFIHCGLHKTGTTSIQASLSAQRARLADNGLLYPSSGRVSEIGGHHILAWELTGDRRQRAAPGVTNELIAEISNFGGNVIVSSEDFETVLDRLDLLARLHNLACRARRSLKMIIYIRDQLSYVASLYQTLLNHGLGEEFLAVANLVLSERQLSHQEWVFQFDYGHLAHCLASLKGSEIIFRNYNALASLGSVIADLGEIIGSPIQAGLEPETRLAQRQSMGASLAKFYQWRAVDTSVTPPETATLNDLAARMQGRKGIPGPALTRAFVDTFASRNQELCAQFAIPTDGLDFCDLADDGNALYMERVFSDRAVLQIRQIATLANRGGAIKDLIAWFAGA